MRRIRFLHFFGCQLRRRMVPDLPELCSCHLSTSYGLYRMATLIAQVLLRGSHLSCILVRSLSDFIARSGINEHMGFATETN